ncbi:hypothetical protein BROC_00894 [Candidatus Brocadiaceae bacterium]|nr:hypothetical protein BROC_00894 [Candidatus Brocadiaceae bacterium]
MNKFCSIFSQLLQLFPRSEFYRAVKETNAEYHARGSSTIDLSLSLFDWAKFRRTKGAVKLHLILDHDGYLPSFAVITEGNVSDVKVAHQLHFDPGTIVMDDRGYNDYSLFGK